jgi:hypothetical protein
MHAVDMRYLPLAGNGLVDLRSALDAHTLAVGRLVGCYERAG